MVKKLHSLANLRTSFIKTTHKSNDLNDNGDGTFSVVGSHNRNGPRVVARKSLDPSEPPLRAPCLPPSLADRPSHGLEMEREEGSTPITTPPSRVASSTPAPTNKKVVAAASATDVVELWDYLCSHIDGIMPIPHDPAHKLLLSLPKMRDLDPVEPLAANINERQITGLIIQAIGEQAPSACTECRRNNGPFASCVQPSVEVATRISGFLRSSYRACANCFLRKSTHRCSVKAGGLVNARTPILKRHLGDSNEVPLDDVPMDDMPMDDAELAQHMSMLDRRRSARIHAQTEDYEDAEDEESGDDAGAPVPESRALRRVMTLKIPQRLRVANLPTEAHLHLEDLEMDDGRISAAGERRSLLLWCLTSS